LMMHLWWSKEAVANETPVSELKSANSNIKMIMKERFCKTSDFPAVRLLRRWSRSTRAARFTPRTQKCSPCRNHHKLETHPTKQFSLNITRWFCIVTDPFQLHGFGWLRKWELAVREGPIGDHGTCTGSSYQSWSIGNKTRPSIPKRLKRTNYLFVIGSQYLHRDEEMNQALRRISNEVISNRDLKQNAGNRKGQWFGTLFQFGQHHKQSDGDIRIWSFKNLGAMGETHLPYCFADDVRLKIKWPPLNSSRQHKLCSVFRLVRVWPKSGILSRWPGRLTICLHQSHVIHSISWTCWSCQAPYLPEWKKHLVCDAMLRGTFHGARSSGQHPCFSWT
jgi:hypothetical protein